MVQVVERARQVEGGDWPQAPGPGRRSTALALLAWAGLVAVAHLWGRHLLDAGRRLQLGTEEGAPPLVGDFDLRLGARALPALVLAALAVALGPRLAARLGWRRLLLAAGLGTAAWAVALALVDPGGLTRPLLLRGEYLRNVADVGSPLAFLDGFTERLATYHTHVQGHPPGMLLLLWVLDRAGLGGASWAAALVVAGGAAAAPAALVTLRVMAGEGRARAAAPFLALAPAAVWVASTADALYMGVIAWGVALVAVAGTRRDRRADGAAVAGGLLFGAALFLSYGALLAAPIAGAVALAQRRGRPLLLAAGAALAVVVAFAAAGFSWPEGLFATRLRYYEGVASRRPYGYFLLANLAAFALVLGPATAVAINRLRHRATWLLVGAALAAVALADLSGLSKGEVERIWLPFAPWVILAACALVRRGAGRDWLGLQAATGLVLQLGVRTPW